MANPSASSRARRLDAVVRWRSILPVRSLIVSIAIAAAVCCGGELVIDQPDGHAGDDGGYFLPDGAPAFTPGAGCMDYEPSPQLADCKSNGLVCTYGWGCSSPSSQDVCASQARNVVPVGFPYFAACRSGGDLPSVCAYNSDIPSSRCSDNWKFVAASPFLACRTGADGDAFCSSYLSQFVRGDARAIARCVSACTPTNTLDGMCVSTVNDAPSATVFTGGTCIPANCGGLDICVTRSGQSRCETPCMPVP